jgi:hypothetical protein
MALKSGTVPALTTALGSNAAAADVVGKFGVDGATITVGTEATDVINVAVQLLDAGGLDMTVRSCVRVYLSDDANGDSIASTAPDSGISIGTDGVLEETTADKAGFVTSESDGDFDINVEESSIDTWYLIVVLPNGKLVASDAITFA